MVQASFFEIPVRDLERAVAFYEALFGLAMEREEIDGNHYAHFPAVQGDGISGSLAYGDSYVPSRDGTRLYLRVDSIDEVLTRAVELGSEIHYPKTDVGSYGFVAEFADSEGNCIALHERPQGMKPCFYLFTGISFAGKSVLSRRLAAHLDVPRVDPDEVSHRFGLGLAGEFLSNAQWEQIHRIAEAEACAHLQAGTSVVYDTTAFTRQERDHLREMAERCGASTRLIFVDTPRDVAHQRWVTNEQTQQRPRVHPDDFAMVADRFEPPGSEEDARRFTPLDDADAWIATYLP